jgi:hypothetical protein
MKQYFKQITLCFLLTLFLLNGCGKQPSEGNEPPAQPTTQITQPTTQTDGNPEEGELPAITVPQQTEPVTEPIEVTTPPAVTKPAPTTQPPVTTQATEPPATTRPTQPPVPADPPEATEPTRQTEPTESPRLDEDELPPVPVF